MSYQKVTGTLSHGAHPGSYNGQDAYNDLFIVSRLNDDRNNNDLSQLYAHGGADGRHSQRVMRYRPQRPTYCDGSPQRERERDDSLTQSVRRLTPLECERLQGFPDGWTDIGEWTDSKGKKHKEADGPRYTALGNAICIPFWEWMAKRICAEYDEPPTMASLFDGIGGFPLAYERAGAKAVWASEIEEFPIAVTKLHFPEVEVSDPKLMDWLEELLG